MRISIVSQRYAGTNRDQVATICPLLPFLVWGDSLPTEDKRHLWVNLPGQKFTYGRIESIFSILIIHFYITAQSIHYDWFIGHDMIDINLREDSIDVHKGSIPRNHNHGDMTDDIFFKEDFFQGMKSMRGGSLTATDQEIIFIENHHIASFN